MLLWIDCSVRLVETYRSPASWWYQKLPPTPFRCHRELHAPFIRVASINDMHVFSWMVYTCYESSSKVCLHSSSYGWYTHYISYIIQEWTPTCIQDRAHSGDTWDSGISEETAAEGHCDGYCRHYYSSVHYTSQCSDSLQYTVLPTALSQPVSLQNCCAGFLFSHLMEQPIDSLSISY